MPLLRGAALCHIALELSGAAGKLAVGIHRYRATLSVAPNFAYELCLNKIDDERLKGLDLSCLRMTLNGAEPVSVPTLRRFTERFARYGFRPDAMAPVYGLAENSVGLAFPPPGRMPVIDRVDREALTRRGIAEPAGANGQHPLEIVSVGLPISGNEVRIVDELGVELGDRHERRLEFRGPCTTAGYFRNEAKTRELIHGDWHDSGDRAYMAGGEIFITGRIKDIIIRGGRNFYPQEIEEAVTDIAGTPPDEVVLDPPRSQPKTSSGKIRRSAARELYETGRIGEPRRAAWRQVLRLSLAGVGTKAARLATVVGKTLYAGWWWIVMALAYVAAWSAVMLLPRLAWRWHAVRGLARAALGATGIPVSIEGLSRLPKGNAVAVFNHLSYMDVLVLSSVLPEEPAYVARSEFAGHFFIGPFMRGLGTVFVERFDTGASLADTEKAISAARQGRMLCSSRRARSPVGPGCPNSISALSRWLRMRGCPLCPAFSAGHGRCSEGANGFRDGPRSA